MMRATTRERSIELVALLAMLALSFALYVGIADRHILDVDVVNLALGIERFDPRQHQPHPPGYLGYVLLLRLLHFVTRLPILAVAHLLSRLFALSTIVLTWSAARRMLPAGRQSAALWAAALVAANPIILYYGVDGQTHSAEAAMAAALLATLPRVGERPSWSRALAVGALLAAGGAMRPTYALIAVIPVVWTFGVAAWPQLIVSGAIAGALTVAWIVPTIMLSGGLAIYRAASQGLVANLVGMTSVLAPGHDTFFAGLNVRATLTWSVCALAPALIALAVRRGGGWSPHVRRAVGLLATMAVPAIAFFALVLCAEAGYLAGLVPIGAVATTVLLADLPRGRSIAYGLAAAELLFFLFAPVRLGRAIMLPDTAMAMERQIIAASLQERFEAGTVPTDRLLVISDFPDLTILRAVPLLRPHTDVLVVGNPERFSLGHFFTLSLTTAHGWRCLPGPAINVPGDQRRLVTDSGYDWLVLDPRSSEQLRAALAAQLRCPLPPPGPNMEAAHLRAAECLPSSTIVWGDPPLEFVFARP